MITRENYFTQIHNIDLASLPEALFKGHEFLVKVTNSGETWTSYSSSDVIKKTIDIYLAKLSEFINKGKKSEKKKQNKETSHTEEQKIIREKNANQDATNLHLPHVRKEKNLNKEKIELHKTTMVERIPDELRFIKRFVKLNGKTKSKEEILRFINSLQKTIVEKRIRKTSAYAEQIRFIQTKLLELYNGMRTKIKIALKPDTYEALKKLTGEEKVMASVNFIKRYIGMNSKPGMKDKAKQLLTQINRAIDKGKINDSDAYITEIHEIKKNLKAFTSSKSLKALQIEKATLNGLEGILGCACQDLSGAPIVMNSMDFVKIEFETIGLKGKWFDLIGDPSRNFTAMVFGRPKMGKSYLCVDFAGYLARNHGKVLYVAKEEGLDYTLQQKLNDKEVAHANLFFAAVLPYDVSSYDFIFLDSVNKLGLGPEDLGRLKKANPTKSFVYIFQTTKDGKFRGANTFQHDVDVVIEIPEKGKAMQMGRFNQGGEILIFQNQVKRMAQSS